MSMIDMMFDMILKNFKNGAFSLFAQTYIIELTTNKQSEYAAK